jgi:hypothetical protein
MGQFVLPAKDCVPAVCTIIHVKFVRRLPLRWVKAPLWSITCRNRDSSGRALKVPVLKSDPACSGKFLKNQANPEASQ